MGKLLSSMKQEPGPVKGPLLENQMVCVNELRPFLSVFPHESCKLLPGHDPDIQSEPSELTLDIRHRQDFVDFSVQSFDDVARHFPVDDDAVEAHVPHCRQRATERRPQRFPAAADFPVRNSRNDAIRRVDRCFFAADKIFRNREEESLQKACCE